MSDESYGESGVSPCDRCGGPGETTLPRQWCSPCRAELTGEVFLRPGYRTPARDARQAVREAESISNALWAWAAQLREATRAVEEIAGLYDERDDGQDMALVLRGEGVELDHGLGDNGDAELAAGPESEPVLRNLAPADARAFAETGRGYGRMLTEAQMVEFQADETGEDLL